MAKQILPFESELKHVARRLRKNMTDSEQSLWSRLRRKQFLGVQFYRQKPIGHYIVDFFAPKAKLVVEIDGSQHRRPVNAREDEVRDSYLDSLGIRVLRFNSREVLTDNEGVVDSIYSVVKDRLVKSP